MKGMGVWEMARCTVEKNEEREETAERGCRRKIIGRRRKRRSRTDKRLKKGKLTLGEEKNKRKQKTALPQHREKYRMFTKP